MVFHDELVGVLDDGLRRRRRLRRGSTGLRSRGGRTSPDDFIITFEDVETFELLIEDSKGLEAFCLDHLSLEPCFHFILLLFLNVLVKIVQMSKEREEGSRRWLGKERLPIQLQERHLPCLSAQSYSSLNIFISYHLIVTYRADQTTGGICSTCSGLSCLYGCDCGAYVLLFDTRLRC